MKTEIRKNGNPSKFTFNSGRSFTANGYIGIMDGDEISIAEGYDGRIELMNKEGQYDYQNENEDYIEPPLSIEEKIELAEYMISLWMKFKDS